MQSAPAPVQEKIKNRAIRKVAILGAGIMGSRIALHFANIGVEAILLDIVPSETTPEEAAKGLTVDHPLVRNRIVKSLFDAALKSNPAPVYDKAFTDRVQLGNFTDNMSRVADCDWIIEVVVERLDIKQKIFDEVEKYRRPGALVTTNTSGIPIAMMTEGRSDDFQRHFCGTHFFNPPRYLPLLEIIPSPHTAPEVLDFLMHYGSLFLGKKTVLCKDTPAFIANRIGIYAIMDLFHLVEKYQLRVEEVDLLTGPLIGHPKSATFRTCDLVGLDTAVKVANGIGQNCPNDERGPVYQLPGYIKQMVDNNMWGDKSGQGFYKKTTNAQGEREILALNLQTMQYESQQKVKDPLLEQTRSLDQLQPRFKALLEGQGRYADFLRDATYGLLAYASHRVPEIADDLYRIDMAISAGFGWEIGPFEQWDILGVRAAFDKMTAAGFQPTAWVKEMLDAGVESFYRIENGARQYYDQKQRAYADIPGAGAFIILDNLRANKVIWKNSGVTVFDLGDEVACVEFNSKMNTLGGDVLQGVQHAIELAEADYRGLVIGNQGENFSVGANLMMIFMLAAEQEWDELNMAVRFFQNTVMRVRYSSVPVVVAPFGMTLGGGCEMTLHADVAVASAETYIGLVEVGVGLLPAGGGTKETVVRISDRYRSGDVETNALRDAFLNIATAKVATSAYEAIDMNILRPGRDKIVVNKDRLLTEAKQSVLELARAGYTQPIQRKDIRVLGRTGLGMVYAGAYQMEYQGYATTHDRKIAEKIGHVLCGGDLTSATNVSEQYLLDLEREAFLSLCGEKKTLERIEHMLKTGKPLRN